MRRRTFLALTASIAAHRVHAQAEVPVVGFLSTGSPETFDRLRIAFLNGLKEVGFNPGRDANLEFRWADGDYNQMAVLAAELVQQRVNVIAATGGEVSALAAKAATSTIPVVFSIGSDPVQRGLVKSWNRPGGNMTGVVTVTFALDAKRLELLRTLLPKADVIGAIVNPARASAPEKIRELREAAAASKCQVVIVQAREEEEFEPAFAMLASKGAGGLMVTPDPFFFTRHRRLVELAAQHRIPAIYESRNFPAAGGLMSYGTSFTDAYRLVGAYVGRILKGEKPADLPVIQSTKFELVINLKVAAALGLDVPATILAQTDEVIE